MTLVDEHLAATAVSDHRGAGPSEGLGVASIAVLEAAQALRRSVTHAPEYAETLTTLASLEATLDSLGASLAELRGPLLDQVEPAREGLGGRARQLDAARLVAQIGRSLSEAATCCAELRNVVRA